MNHYKCSTSFTSRNLLVCAAWGLSLVLASPVASQEEECRCEWERSGTVLLPRNSSVDAVKIPPWTIDAKASQNSEALDFILQGGNFTLRLDPDITLVQSRIDVNPDAMKEDENAVFASADPGTGVHGRSTTGTGVEGFSNEGTGVYGRLGSGFSATDFPFAAGVRGDSELTFGVVGRSKVSTGVIGMSTDLFGVVGESERSTGVLGQSKSGFGVSGRSDSNTGVRGTSESASGVRGESKSGDGVSGKSESGVGVKGRSDLLIGIAGTSKIGIGVSGESESGGGVFGKSAAHIGVMGASESEAGVFGTSTSGVGVRAVSAVGDLIVGEKGSGTSPAPFLVNNSGEIFSMGLLIQSDIGGKTDIRPLADVLPKLGQIRGISFKWGNAGGLQSGQERRRMSAIAQEVEAVFPDLVTNRREGHRKAVDFAGLTAVLIEAVKSLSLENDKLKTRLAALEERLTAVEVSGELGR
jgi:hypothetical protein